MNNSLLQKIRYTHTKYAYTVEIINISIRRGNWVL